MLKCKETFWNYSSEISHINGKSYRTMLVLRTQQTMKTHTELLHERGFLHLCVLRVHMIYLKAASAENNLILVFHMITLVKCPLLNANVRFIN